ncbi:serine/threonine protein kinase [Nocardia vinacea]|uniref:non-specific serine/threonine protein kinase n=1 Tax=Nocardia vinacea TaxID=96468 RepID=A0ABZ1YSS7_9NOCA|nr:serine/threonine-protein kinase [Nocardia vinacea]
MDSRKLLPGTVFAGYRIERLLGSGGMGTVYVAAHPRLPRRDALKVLSAEYSTDPEFRARFVREAELAARLDHPNIIGVYDRGIEHGRLWIAMRFMDGPDAAELIRHRTVASPQRILHIIGAVARGLDHAHRAGMLHRDVKPANILVESIPGQPDRVAITDFGIAKAAAATTVLTQAGSILATIAYAAPEQLTGAAVDHRADVYSLGCTLYELLTAAKPFPRARTDAVIMAHLQDPPPRPTATVPELPGQIDDVIARALAKDPQQRYPSCGALAAAAATAFGVAQDPVPAIGHRPARRRNVGIGVGVLTAVAVLAIASIFVLNRNSTQHPASASAPADALSSVPSATVPVDPNSWAAHERVIKAFPQLLPKTQTDSGYQGLRCVAIDGDQRPIDARQTRDSMNSLACNGNRDPVSRILVRCGIDKPADEFVPSQGGTFVGEESWVQPTGQGHATWYDTTGVTGPTGELLLRFDDAARANCTMGVSGGTSGQDLYERWWRNAPV